MDFRQLKTHSHKHIQPAYGNGSGSVKDTELFKKTGKWALEAGFYHLDTAQRYGQGLQEAATGELLKQFPEDQIYLTSKLSATGPDFEDPWPIDQIRASVIDSIGKLGRKPESVALSVHRLSLSRPTLPC